MTQQTDRRHLFKKAGILGAGLVGVGLSREGWACESTPAQMAGPFYPEEGRRWEDEDLTLRRGSRTPARGRPIEVAGRVTFGNSCAPLEGAMVEIWQADDNGKYKHSGDNRDVDIDPNFQYWGRTYTDAQGWYRFKTIYPGKYPGRTRHIHYRIVSPEGESLITQLYFSREDALNREDGIYRDLLARDVADRVTIDLPGFGGQQVSRGRFDIALAADSHVATPHAD